MAPPKKVQTQVKLQIAAGKATPAPPVGPALGQAQINIMEFCFVSSICICGRMLHNAQFPLFKELQEAI